MRGKEREEKGEERREKERDLSQKMLNQKKKKRNDPGCFRVPDKMGFMKKRPSVRS